METAARLCRGVLPVFSQRPREKQRPSDEIMSYISAATEAFADCRWPGTDEIWAKTTVGVRSSMATSFKIENNPRNHSSVQLGCQSIIEKVSQEPEIPEAVQCLRNFECRPDHLRSWEVDKISLTEDLVFDRCWYSTASLHVRRSFRFRVFPAKIRALASVTHRDGGGLARRDDPSICEDAVSGLWKC